MKSFLVRVHSTPYKIVNGCACKMYTPGIKRQELPVHHLESYTLHNLDMQGVVLLDKKSL